MGKWFAGWDQYIEYSSGNFKYFNNDSNIVRNAGLPLFFGLLIGFLSILLRLLIKYGKFSNFRNLVVKYKKYFYRFIDWLYKLTMYPIIFYSLNTIINYKENISLVN